MARCDDEGLDTLARAARRRGELDIARRALLALRERHAASPFDDAAFVLGRRTRKKMAGRRTPLVSRCLPRRARRGDREHTGYALGRKMALVERLSGAAAARPLAELYLRLYPNGAHGAYARHLLSNP